MRRDKKQVIRTGSVLWSGRESVTEINEKENERIGENIEEEKGKRQISFV